MNEQELKAAEQTETPKKSHFGRNIFILLFLAIVTTCVYFVLLFWQQYQTQVLDRIYELEQNRDEQSQAVAEVSFLLEQSITKQSSQWQDFMQVQDHWSKRQEQVLTELHDRLNNVLSDNDYKWLFAESKYWLDLAEKRLGIDSDYLAVKRLLQSARLQLQVYQSDATTKIIAAIDEDLNNIDSIQYLSKSELYFQITQLQQKLNTVEFLSSDNVLQQNEDKVDAIVADPNLSFWQQYRQIAVQFMKSLVIIETNDDDVRVDPFNEDQQFYIRRKINLELEVAKLAIFDQRWNIVEQQLSSVINTATDSLDAEPLVAELILLRQIVKNYNTPIVKLTSPFEFELQMKKLNFELE